MTTTANTVEQRQSTSSPVGWAPLAVLMTGTFVFVLDFFVVNVALPSMQHDLGASAAVVEWVVAGYALTTAACLISGGRLGDHFGRRRVFVSGLALFATASAGCALAPNGVALVVMRLVQGMAAGVMAPNVLSILGVVYSGSRRVRAISVYGMVMGVSATAGQLFGGFLLRADVFGLGWRTIFWINVPIVLAALAACRLVPESRDERSRRLDPAGMLLVTAALVAVVLPLVDGRQHGWPLWSWLCLGASPLVFGAFAVHQRRSAARGGTPLVNFSDLSGRGAVAGLLTQLVFWCQQAATYLFLAVYLQAGRGMSPLGSGLVFSALAAGYLITSSVAPTLTVRHGSRVVLVGALAAAAGDLLLALAVHEHSSVAALLPGLVVLGAGQGLCITPLTSTVLGYATPATAGTVSAALSTTQQAGNAIGVAVVGVVFFGGVGDGYGHAFERTLFLLAGVLAIVAALTRTWPRRAPVISGGEPASA